MESVTESRLFNRVTVKMLIATGKLNRLIWHEHRGQAHAGSFAKVFRNGGAGCHRVKIPDDHQHQVVGYVAGAVVCEEVIAGRRGEDIAVSDDRLPIGMRAERGLEQCLGQPLVGIALPLFIVTMASQNIPGIAVLKVNGYEPDPAPLFATTGVFSLLSAPFGSHAVNLAAITAAMCAGSDAHPDPKKRYWAPIIAGICYVVFGPFAGAVTAFVSLAPPILIQAVAGLALIGAFANSALNAFKDVDSREAAAVTFLVTASGVSFAGISGAFWGLIAGGLVLALARFTARLRA